MARELSFSEKRDWLRLTRTSTVGPVAFRDLMKRFKGDAGEALAALPDIARSSKLSIPEVHLVEDELERTETYGAKMIASCEPDFPPALAAINPPPPIITVAGNVSLLHKPSLAIIGSRNASAIGLRFARQMAVELGAQGFTIISGLARGIDTSAHGGSIDKGTAAVLGGGVDHIYPKQNTELYAQILQHGAIISESPIGYRATARDFPRRNRIISGLSLGVVVIEAAERSGTLITARYALEQGREVMAAPGSPLDPRTKGCNRLIRQGAALIESAQDVMDVLENVRPPNVMEERDSYSEPDFDWKAAASDIEAAKTNILGLMSPTPTQRDEIIRQSEFPLPIAVAAMLELELSGQIIVEGDGRASLNF